MKRLLGLVCVSFFLFSCDDKDSGSGGAPADSVTAADMAVPTNPGTATQQVVTDFMADTRFLANSDANLNKSFVALSNNKLLGFKKFNSATKQQQSIFKSFLKQDDDEDDEDENKIFECLDLENQTIVAEGNKISLVTSKNVASCMKQAVGNDINLNVSKAYFGINIQLECEDGDYSQFNGKKFSEFFPEEKENIDIIRDCGKTVKIFVNIKSDLAVSASESGQTMSVEASFRIIMASEDGKSCTFTRSTDGDYYLDNGCVDFIYNKMSSTHNGEKTENITFEKLNSESLEIPDVGKYMKSGKHKFNYANWSGEITHKNTGFDYTATNGTDTVTGSVP